MADNAAPRWRQPVLIGGLLVLIMLLVAVLVYLVRSGREVEAVATTSTTTPPSTTTLPPTTTTTTLPPTTTTTTLPPARVFTFEAVADTTVDSSSPNESFGNRPELSVDGAEEARRTLIAFDVEGLPADLEHMRAGLRLTVLDSSDTQGSVRLVDGEWDEGTTWDTAPEVGDPVALVPLRPEGATVEVDVTDAILGDGRISFYITVDSSDDMAYASREAGTMEPALIVSIGAVASGPPPLLLGAGDIASCDSDGDEATAGLIDAVISGRDDAVVFTVGDSVYESGTISSYEDCYEPSWGRFLGMTRPSPGSRDYSSLGASGYFEYFGSRAGDPEEGYYWYSHGAWTVYALNSNCSLIGGCGPGSPQYEWFVSALGSSDTLCAAAYWQRPVYSSGTEGTFEEMAPLFEAAADGGVDVLINGNDHIYERFAPRSGNGLPEPTGIRQFTVGTGGRSLDDFGRTDELSEFASNQSFGVLVLELFNGSYGWDFLSVSGGGVDSGSAACH